MASFVILGMTGFGVGVCDLPFLSGCPCGRPKHMLVTELRQD